MGVRDNIILATDSTDSDWWVNVLRKIEPLLMSIIGTPRKVMFQDLATNDVTYTSLVGIPSSIAQISPEEIVAIYSEDVAAGCVQLAVEGRFRTMTLSVSPKGDLRELTKQAWTACGEHVDVVLAGEELEVDEASLDHVVIHARIPERLDLCEEAIVRPRLRDQDAFEGNDVELGGILVMSRGKHLQ